jgi:hypothetical protein
MDLKQANPFGAFIGLFGNSMTNMNTVLNGVPGFFEHHACGTNDGSTN